MASPRSRRKVSSRRRSALEDFEFNPNSLNAQFASIHAKIKASSEEITKRLSSQDLLLQAIKSQTEKTNGRVTTLETERRVTKGFIFAIAGAMSSLVVAAGVVAKFIWH